MSDLGVNDQGSIREPSLAEIAFVFLKLGTIAFGGPAAHLALMEEEFVRRRKWITQAEFLDRMATANLIPGPSSTEVAIFVGQLKRGWRGLMVAGCCFIVPAAAIVTVIAWGYVRLARCRKPKASCTRSSRRWSRLSSKRWASWRGRECERLGLR